jgi:integrase
MAETRTERRRSLGSITYRARRDYYEIRVRERPGSEPTSTYLRPAGTGDTEPRRRAAEEDLATRIAGVGRGERHTSRTLTVGRWLDDYLVIRFGPETPGVRQSETERAYRSRVRLYLAKSSIAGIKLADLEPADVARLWRDLGRMRGKRTERLSPGTIEAVAKVLSAALRMAWSLGKIRTDPMRLAKPPRSTTRIEPPTQAEIDEILEEIGDHEWRAVFETIRWTGARLGEVLGLERRLVDLDSRTLRFSRQEHGGGLKTSTPRPAVVIPEELAARLRRIPARVGSPLLFSTISGRPLDERNVLRVFDAACTARGIRPSEYADREKYRIHDLRHAFATMLLEAGAPAPLVQAWLGHGSLRMLDRYAHVVARPGGDSFRRVVDAFGSDADAILPSLRHAPALRRVVDVDEVPDIHDPRWPGYGKTLSEVMVAPPNARNVTPR